MTSSTREESICWWKEGRKSAGCARKIADHFRVGPAFRDQRRRLGGAQILRRRVAPQLARLRVGVEREIARFGVLGLTSPAPAGPSEARSRSTSAP